MFSIQWLVSWLTFSVSLFCLCYLLYILPFFFSFLYNVCFFFPAFVFWDDFLTLMFFVCLTIFPLAFLFLFFECLCCGCPASWCPYSVLLAKPLGLWMLHFSYFSNIWFTKDFFLRCFSFSRLNNNFLLYHRHHSFLNAVSPRSLKLNCTSIDFFYSLILSFILNMDIIKSLIKTKT